jgi:prevent-host-death family protein
MQKIPATKFKAQCLDLMDRVAERRESYLITKRGKPVAKLVPIRRKPKDSLFGCLRSMVSIRGDIENPVLPPEAWETVKEWDELMGNDKPLTPGASKKHKSKRSRR